MLLSWAAERTLQVGVVGSGSNLLIADEGVRGLVIKLDGELSRIEPDGERLRCGGGARLPAVSIFSLWTAPRTPIARPCSRARPQTSS